jgi:hypothetical protein
VQNARTAGGKQHREAKDILCKRAVHEHIQANTAHLHSCARAYACIPEVVDVFDPYAVPDKAKDDRAGVRVAARDCFEQRGHVHPSRVVR